ncbi:MAG: response regulator [Candidatus Omnitrophota bacterium]|jgi:twitching motility two-component system response regulator PilH
MKKILVCEDSSFFRNVFDSYFKKEGFAVVTAKDGQEAVTKTRLERPDLVLLDVILPDIDGCRVCRLLKADPELKMIPVLMCSVRGGDDDAQRGYDAGADAYLPKSGSPELLLNKIKELIP